MADSCAHGCERAGVLSRLVQDDLWSVVSHGLLDARQHRRRVEPAENLAIGDERRLLWTGTAEAAPQQVRLARIGGATDTQRHTDALGPLLHRLGSDK